MVHGSFAYPLPDNEPVRSYAPGSPERERVQARYQAMKGQGPIEIMARINGTAVSTHRHTSVTAPHDHGHILGRAHLCGENEAAAAMAAAMEARRAWAALSFEARAGIFMKAADMLAGPWRDTLNVATMLGQGKNIFQAEIDAACELIDFIRFNVAYAAQIYAEQPVSADGIWNRLEYRPLEGFVFAVTPFNFTAIQANLALAPALMGNVVVWKPSNTALFSAHYLMDLFEAAGMPRGVINMLPGDGADVGEPILASPDLAGLHFTGSTRTFQHLWREIGSNIERYRSYPRIVGETGGKDFVLMHRSADPTAVATALVRGAFEYQGQKCSAASRAYIPRSQWEAVRMHLVSQLSSISVGSPEDFSTFVNAVIDRRSFERITAYIETARADGVTILHGGTYRDNVGYFVDPTVLVVDDPHYRTMEEEIFGPVLTIYVYEDAAWEKTLDALDATSPYALTGALFATDRYVIDATTARLRDNAGNFYVNDKPTGAVVGQQPFGGARGSGTNDKAGSYLNLLRWVSPRTIKETFVPPTDYRYPFLG